MHQCQAITQSGISTRFVLHSLWSHIIIIIISSDSEGECKEYSRGCMNVNKVDHLLDHLFFLKKMPLEEKLEVDRRRFDTYFIVLVMPLMKPQYNTLFNTNTFIIELLYCCYFNLF